MKRYLNQTKNNTKDLGLENNFAFASDKKMTPNGIDIAPYTDKYKNKSFELVIYDDYTETADIWIGLTRKQLDKILVDELFNE